jgi:type I restriction-modification system DNA methylase subunit
LESVQVLTSKDIERLAKYIGHTYDAFFSLSNIPKNKSNNKQEMEVAIVDLLANVVLSQIIFYSIYQRINQDIPKLPSKINSIDEIEKCFDNIRAIDYRPIYEIHALTLIPPAEPILEILAQTIQLLETLRPDQIEHDLLGQLFGKVMPPNSKKTLAAFYSRTSASDILARLAIRDWNLTVWDIACGSGTILMSAYKTKRDLYKNRLSPTSRDIRAMHKSFIEEQITGNDIMAFACVLSGLNLAVQDITSKTDNVRIFKMDSLKLPELLNNGSFEVQSATSLVAEEIRAHRRSQKILGDYMDMPKTVTPQINAPQFLIEKVDVVLMNPPFTVKTNLKQEFLERMKNCGFASKRCGHDIDLWGYFLAMAPDMVWNGGTIGAIVPTGFLKGKHTQKIRDYYLDNLSIRYMIKPTQDDTLSGSANFRDMMLICENKNPAKDDKIAIVLLKTSLEGVPTANSILLANEIERLAVRGGGYSESVEVKVVKRELLQSHRENMMPFFVPRELDKKMKGLDEILKNCDKLRILDLNDFKYGIDLHKDYSKALYVQRILPNRSFRGRIMGFESTSDKTVEVIAMRGRFKEERQEVPLHSFDFGLITPTGMQQLDISSNFDLIVKLPFALAKKIAAQYSVDLSQSNIRREVGPEAKKGKLFLVERFRFASDNSYLLAFYSKEPAHVSNVLYPINTRNDEEAKILCLSMNSVISILQVCRLKSETQMNYGHIGREDWAITKQLDIAKLTYEEKKELLDLFDNLSTKSFPSIRVQLEKRTNERRNLDTTILRVLGLKTKEIDEILPVLYDVAHSLITSIED